MNQQVTTYEVAAFSNQATAGSPTGVVLNAGGLLPAQMQQIARAMNVSHTAFVHELQDDECDIDIRFFTPLYEIKNCGHATIAAHFLRATQSMGKYDTLVKQRTTSGIQEITIYHHDLTTTIHFTQNEIRFCAVPSDVADELLSALNLSKSDLDADDPLILASPGAWRFLVALRAASILKGVSPDFKKLRSLCDRVEAIGCFVYTIESSVPPLEAKARMFAPNIGIDEDIINGNSSGCLGAYLLHRSGQSKLQLQVHQGHTFNRLGTVLVNAEWVGDKMKTTVGGNAVLVTKRQLILNN